MADLSESRISEIRAVVARMREIGRDQALVRSDVLLLFAIDIEKALSAPLAPSSAPSEEVEEEVGEPFTDEQLARTACAALASCECERSRTSTGDACSLAAPLSMTSARMSLSPDIREASGPSRMRRGYIDGRR
jgi:hypothetical protein